MENSFRLKSNTMFIRSDEEHKGSPFRIVFLSVEGNKTEQQYFEYIEKFRKQLNIKATVHIHPLQRSKNDNLSAPDDVLELLEEYIELRNSDTLPERLQNVIPSEYTYEFVKDYINGKSSDLQKNKDFEEILQNAGIDLQYEFFLKEYTGVDDVFGIVIDRDYKSHSVKQMKDIILQCQTKGYKCFVTTPCIEFWLLLHLVDVMDKYPANLNDFIENKNLSQKHTFTSKQVSLIANHSKSINEKTFKEFYLPNIDFAIEQTKSNFTMNLDDLIGNNSSEESKKGKLGSNLPELFDLLRDV